MQKTANPISRILNRQHDIRININQQHAEGNRKQQQRLKSFLNCQIQENEGHENHDHISDSKVQEGRLLNQIGQCCSDIFHIINSSNRDIFYPI